jgi:hypothetical protein
MPCTLRRPELKESPPPAPLPSRLDRLKELICRGDWIDEENLVLIYWKPEQQRWVAWVDGSPPAVDPLPEAGVVTAP